MTEIQIGDKVTVKPMLHGRIEREYIVVDINGDDVLLRTVSKKTLTGRMFWEATYEKYMFHFNDGGWSVP